MDARRALLLTNGFVDVRPMVLLAAKVLGPGSLRLKMVKLFHELDGREGDLLTFAGRPEIPNHEHLPAREPERG